MYDEQPVGMYACRAKACRRISHFWLLSTKRKQRSLEGLVCEDTGQNGRHGPGSWIRAGWIPGYLNAPGFSRRTCGALEGVQKLPQSADKGLRPSRGETWAGRRVGVTHLRLRQVRGRARAQQPRTAPAHRGPHTGRPSSASASPPAEGTAPPARSTGRDVGSGRGCDASNGTPTAPPSGGCCCCAGVWLPRGW